MFLILLYWAQHSYNPKKINSSPLYKVYSVIPSNLSRLKSTVIHTTVHYCNVIDSTTLPLLLFSSFILTSSLSACSILSSAKTSEKANTRKMARALTCRQAGVICRRLPGNRNHRVLLASTQRSNVCACVQVVITTWSAVRNELHTASHTSESRCFETVFVFG